MPNLLITWNIDGQVERMKAAERPAAVRRVRRCLQLLGRIVGTFNESVVLLQEVPGDLAQLVATECPALAVHTPFSRNIAIATTVGVGVTELEFLGIWGEGDGRALSSRISGLLPRSLALIGLHNHAQMHASSKESVRESAGIAYGMAVRQKWDGVSDLVVAGDFNDQPYALPLVGQRAFWAIRDRRDLESKWGTSRVGPPLFNPMWKFLPEGQAPPYGSYSYLSNEESGVRWKVYDQVLSSESLADLVADVKILTEFKGEELVNRRSGIPRRGVYSDHLPVYLEIGAT